MSHNVIQVHHNVIIPNQPIAFHRHDEPVERCDCMDRAFSQMYYDDDMFAFQIKSYLIGDDLFTSYNYGTNWNNNYYGNCHVTGAAGDLRVLNILSVGSNYQVVITVSDYEAGEITVKLGTSIIGYISSDGTYTFSGQANGVNLVMSADEDFVGCVNADDIRAICSDFEVYMREFDPNDPDNTDSTPLVTIINLSQKGDRVWLMEEWSDYLSPEKCVNICIASCNLVVNGQFTSDLNGWTAGAGWTWVAGEAHLDSAVNTSLEQDIGAVNGELYNIQITVTDLISGSITVGFGGGTNTFPITANGVYNFDLENDGDIGTIEIVSSTFVNMDVDNIEIRTLEGCTNPIRIIDTPVLESELCKSKMIEWRSDEDAFGFDYTNDSDFYFSLRLQEGEIAFRSNYDEDGEQYTDAAGSASTLYSALRKIRNLLVKRINGDMLDALFVGRRHDEFLIDNFEYVVPNEDGFEPDYQNNANLASVNIQIGRPDQDLYNTLC